MSIGSRVQRLRLRHGHTLRDAEKQTGVTRSTLCRLENGACPPGLERLLTRIALGYGVPSEQLLRDPAGDFAWLVGRLDVGQRLHLLRWTLQSRTYVALCFLLNHCPRDAAIGEVAQQAGVTKRELSALVADWQRQTPDRNLVERLAAALIRAVQLPASWFEWGYLPSESLRRELPRSAPGMAAADRRRLPLPR